MKKKPSKTWERLYSARFRDWGKTRWVDKKSNCVQQTPRNRCPAAINRRWGPPRINPSEPFAQAARKPEAAKTDAIRPVTPRQIRHRQVGRRRIHAGQQPIRLTAPKASKASGQPQANKYEKPAQGSTERAAAKGGRHAGRQVDQRRSPRGAGGVTPRMTNSRQQNNRNDNRVRRSRRSHARVHRPEALPSAANNPSLPLHLNKKAQASLAFSFGRSTCRVSPISLPYKNAKTPRRACAGVSI